MELVVRETPLDLKEMGWRAVRDVNKPINVKDQNIMVSVWI